MKIFFALSIVLCLGLSATVQRNDERKLEPFDKLTVFGNLQVELIKSDSIRIVLSSQEIDLSKVNNRIDKGELKIRMNTDLYAATKKVKIKLYYKNLKEISSTGGADLFSEGVLKADKIVFVAASGGNIMMSLDVNILEASVDEGSGIVFDGNASYQKVRASSGGTYSAFELICDDAFVKANMGGKIKIYAGRLLDATAATKGYIGYKGTPEKTNFNATLGGEIKEAE